MDKYSEVYREVSSYQYALNNPIRLMLGEASTTAIVKTKNPKGFVQNKIAAKQGGTIAGDARKALEIKTGEKVVSKGNYLPEKRVKELNKGKIGS